MGAKCGIERAATPSVAIKASGARSTTAPVRIKPASFSLNKYLDVELREAKQLAAAMELREAAEGESTPASPRQTRSTSKQTTARVSPTKRRMIRKTSKDRTGSKVKDDGVDSKDSKAISNRLMDSQGSKASHRCKRDVEAVNVQHESEKDLDAQSECSTDTPPADGNGESD